MEKTTIMARQLRTYTGELWVPPEFSILNSSNMKGDNVPDQ
jgi:hypothetical protein